MTSDLVAARTEIRRSAAAPLRPPRAPVPRRVLVVSADIGGGHNATGRALQERVLELWPGSQVRWVDTLDAMGPGVGRAFRRTYVTNVEVTPWLYEFFYASLWRHRWFAEASKRFVGAWAGRRLRPVVEAFDPDLILSTYPLGSAGLAWLRERRGLGVPLGAWVSDFAPHPFWVYPQLDLNLLMHPAALPLAAVAAPGTRAAVCAPPVLSGFCAGDRVEARRRRGLAPARPVVVVSCGSLGFGAVEEAVRALVAEGGDVQLVVVCGRNERLARRLAALGQPATRLQVLGWVDDMPTLLQAADVLITNAGGATALEAMATGTPVVMYRPIAAHGAANAALMTFCGLAETCRDPAGLVACVRSRLAIPQDRSAPEAVPGHLPDLGLPAVADAEPTPTGRPGRRPPSWPLRPQDAFFRYVESATVAQQIGAVLDLGPLPDGRPLTRVDLVDLLEHRLPVLVALRRRLVERGRWRRPGWIVEPRVDAWAQVDEYRIPPGGDSDRETAAVLDRFWSQPLSTDRPPWRMLLVTGLPEGRTALAVKLHHCLGDGLSAIGTLRRLFDPVPGRDGGARVEHPGRGPRPARLGERARAGLRRTASTVRGLARLAVAGRAPRTTLNLPLRTPQRRLVTTTLPTAEVNRVARACGAHVSELVCALVAEALRRTYPGEGMPERLRAMFAVSRDPRIRSRTQGNWTGAIALDLPLAPAPMPDRVAAVREALRRSLTSGQPAAATLVMRAMGALPAPVHAAAARLVYTSRFVNVIVSYVAGAVRAHTLAGAPVRAAVPVVALADGVPIGVGVLRWADTVGIGVLLDAALADSGDAFAAALRDAFDETRATVAHRTSAPDRRASR